MASALRIIGYLIIAAFLALLVLFGVLFGLFTFTSSQSEVRSLYQYDLYLSTEQPLYNATLLIPAPVYYDETRGANVTVLNIPEMNFEEFEPGEIDITLEEIDGIPMLKIYAAEIRPIYKNHIEPIMILPGQDEEKLPEPTSIYSDTYSAETPDLVDRSAHLYMKADTLIDTKDPLGKEPLFEPYIVMEQLESDTDTLYGEYYIASGTSGFLVEIPVFASYTTADNNTVVISSEFTGINQWWILGWQSNSYRERFTAELTGCQDGRQHYEAVIVTGDGVYR